MAPTAVSPLPDTPATIRIIRSALLGSSPKGQFSHVFTQGT